MQAAQCELAIDAAAIVAAVAIDPRAAITAESSQRSEPDAPVETPAPSPFSTPSLDTEAAPTTAAADTRPRSPQGSKAPLTWSLGAGVRASHAGDLGFVPGAWLGGEVGCGFKALLGDEPSDMGDALPTVAFGSGKTFKAFSNDGDGSWGTPCVLFTDNSLKCWGYNADGQLGLGDTIHRGDDPLEMGDHLPTVKLGTGRYPVMVSSGYMSSCALLDNGKVKCWGAGANGQLGYGDKENRGDQPGEMGDSLPYVDLGL